MNLAKQGLWLICVAGLLAGCDRASDEVHLVQIQEQNQAVLANFPIPDLVPSQAQISTVEPSEDGLATDAKGEFTGEPKKLADSIHASMQAEGWTPRLVTQQPEFFYMSYTRGGEMVIYELGITDNQNLIKVSYLPPPADQTPPG